MPSFSIILRSIFKCFAGDKGSAEHLLIVHKDDFFSLFRGYSLYLSYLPDRLGNKSGLGEQLAQGNGFHDGLEHRAADNAGGNREIKAGVSRLSHGHLRAVEAMEHNFCL